MSQVNIDAYFERIAFSGSIAPTLETLQQLHALHPAAIPFENLDPLLGVPVRLELKNLEQKLLFDRRGGYCFEHNLLFKALLEDLDFPVKGLAARVYWGHEETAERPLSHMALLVDVGGTSYLADVGFGGMTLTAPLRLRADIEQQMPHGIFRLVGGTPDWRLEVQLGETWKLIYRFDLEEKPLTDYQAMNDLTSTDPVFTAHLIAARAEKGRRLALRDRRYSVYPVDGPEESRELTSLAELRETLTGPFGIALPPTERLDQVLGTILSMGTP
jgi:N-hydroxyarylamine O-acetyltransferase